MSPTRMFLNHVFVLTVLYILFCTVQYSTIQYSHIHFLLFCRFPFFYPFFISKNQPRGTLIWYVTVTLIYLLYIRHDTTRRNMIWFDLIWFDLIYREEHIQKKIDGMITEAKTKMGKGDKKGELLQVFLLLLEYISSSNVNCSRLRPRRIVVSNTSMSFYFSLPFLSCLFLSFFVC